MAHRRIVLMLIAVLLIWMDEIRKVKPVYKMYVKKERKSINLIRKREPDSGLNCITRKVLTLKRGNMNRFRLLLAALMMPAAWLYSENGSIRGTVTDAQTQEPLYGANVLLLDT